MDTPRSPRFQAAFSLTLLAAACWLAAAPRAAWAQADALTPDELRQQLAKPQSTIDYTLLGLRDDNRRFGQWRGLTERGLVASLDMNVVKREDESGTWWRFYARDLGLTSAEVRVTAEQQGQWSIGAVAQRIVRREPLEVVTGLSGIGSATQVVSGSAPKLAVQLEQQRETVEFMLRRLMGPRWDVRLNVRQDTESGARMLGRGGPNVNEFLTEPIDRVTTQWNSLVSYREPLFQVSGGLSGSVSDNNLPVLFSKGGNTNTFGAQWVMAMPPSNAAFQAQLSGGLTPSPGMRGSFKLSRTVAVQNEVFDPVFVRLANAPESLHGRVVTTLGYVDFSMRPAPRVDTFVSLRQEDRDDETPVERYLNESAPSTAAGGFSSAGVSGYNKPRSLLQRAAKAEASYRWDGGYRFTAGLEHETLNRTVTDKYRRMGFRAHTGETSLRLEARRTMSETLNGSVALVRMDRGGSEYVPDTYDPAALTNQLASLLWADRLRDKLRATVDWTPQEQLSAQWLVEASSDEYSGRQFGPHQGRYRFGSVDAQWGLTPQWSLNGWVSYGLNATTQVTRTDRNGAPALGFDTIWQGDLQTLTRAAGLSLRGSLRAGHILGAELVAQQDNIRHDIAQVGGSGKSNVAGLPEMFYRQITLKGYGEWLWQRDVTLRLELGVERRSNNDWTWLNWTYNGAPSLAAAARVSDGTTVTNLPSERLGYGLLTLRYRWN